MRRCRGPAGPAVQVDLTAWLALLIGAVGVALLLLAVGGRAGVGAPPFTGSWRLPHVSPASLLAPVVAAVVVVAVWRGVPELLGWRVLLAAGWVATAAWGLALAAVDGGRRLTGPAGLLRDAGDVHGDPAGYLSSFLAHAPLSSVPTRTHPPGAVLLIAGLRDLGLTRQTALGVAIVLLGALVTPLAALCVRSLCHEAAGRRVVGLLCLAPGLLWSPTTVDGVAGAVAAAGIACAVHASETGRGDWPRRSQGFAAGLLVGSASLLSYGVAWLSLSVLAVWFVRRRAAMVWVSAIGALVPLGLVAVAGFSWADGLALARRDFLTRVAPDRDWWVWLPLDLVVVLVLLGPFAVTAARGLRRTPGWPLLVGPVAALAFTVAAGLGRGELERTWLPFVPWLLVPVVAPRVRPERAGDEDSSRVAAGLLGLTAGLTIAVQALLLVGPT